MVRLLFNALVVLFAPALCVAQSPGQLDASFGGIGYVITNGSVGLERAAAVLIQPDGRIIASGEASYVQGIDLGVARFLGDGQLDPGFGTAGSTAVQADWTELVHSSALQPDGRSVFAGSTHDTAFKALLVRLDTSGILDPSLAGTGTYVLYYPGEPAGFSDVAVQPDGKILACGYLGSDMWLHRILLDGTPDPSFGVLGHVRIPLSTAPTSAWTLALQPNAQIVVAGSSIARFNTNGTLDVSFGILGGGQLPLDINDPLFYDVAVQPDGSIVATGTVDQGADIAVVRLLEDGTPDNSFALDGSLDAALPDSASYTTLALQTDGMIVVAGGIWDEGVGSILLTRIQANGQLDLGFGQNGSVILSPPGPVDRMDFATGVCIQDDGRIVVSAFHLGGTILGFLVARFHGSGLPLSITSVAPPTQNRVFPVPTHDEMQLECGECAGMSVTITLHDADGRLQRDWSFAKAWSKPFIVDVRGLAPGQYVLTAQCGQHRGSQMVVVE